MEETCTTRPASPCIHTCYSSDIEAQVPLLHDPLLGQESIRHHTVELAAETSACIHDDAPQI